MTVYFATSAAHPHLTQDDQRLLNAARDVGLDVKVMDWLAPHPRASLGDLVVIRSCWDYHLYPEEFRSWVRGIEAAGAQVANGARTVLDTMDKRYLIALRDANFARIPPTQLVRAGSRIALDQIMDDLGSRDIVVKPTISLSACNTFRITHDSLDQERSRFEQLSAGCDLLVQAFIPEIQIAGELSLVFLGGHFSHAVRKRPAPGDFRVQTEHGGSFEAVSVDHTIVLDAARCLDGLTLTSIYGRVDGVVVEGQFVLMEVELIDPVLYLSLEPLAAGVLARKVAFMASMAVSLRPLHPQHKREDIRSESA